MSNKNDLSGAYIVLDGALFTCNQGATPNSIVATNKEKVYAQNKKVITTEDITFQTPSLTFGTCLLSTNKQAGQPCVYANGEWDKKSCYDEKIVLDSSKMYCSACTPQGGEITCLYHGQQCSVSATDFANFEIESAVLFNSLLPFNELENKKSEKTNKKPSFSVNSIDLTRIKKSENANIPIAQEEKNPKHIRPNEKLILEAKRNSKVSLEGEPVSWIIFQKETIKASTPKGKPQTKIKNLKIYPKVGTPFTIQLAKTGKYYIEAIGNGNDYKSLKSYYQMQKSLAENEWIVNKERIPLDAKCCKEIEVCANDIVRLSPQGDYPKVNSSSTSAWDLKDAKEPLFLRAENFQKSLPSNSISFVVKQNEPFVLKVDTIFELAHDEFLTVHFNNILLTYMLNKNASTSFYSFNPLTKLFTLKGLNSGDYRIRFELNCLNASSIFKPKTLGVGGLRIHCISDFLDIKTSSGETENPQNIRPGDSLQFKADSSKCKIDSSKIEWSWGKAIPKNNKKKPNKAKKDPEPEPVRTTKKCDKLIINSEKEEYRLRVDACIEDPNFLFQDMNGEKDLETAKKWSFECNVINNRIKRIWLDAEEAFVGMTYNLYTEYLYPDYIPTKDGEIKGSLNDEVLTMENGKQSLVFENPGKQQISLTMGNTETVTEEFDVYDITVEEWVFLDSEQHIIKQVGFGTKFQLSIYIPAFKYLTEKERSDIRLELWDERTGKKLETDALHNVMMDDKGHINAELTGYDLSENTDDITLSCALVNLPYHVSGLNDEKHNGHFFYAKAKKLIISEKEYINGFFAGSTGNPQKSILRYGMEAKIVLYMHNLSQSKIENCTLQLVENDDLDDLKDTLIWKSDIPKPNDDGRVEIVIPENIINEADHNAETPRIPRLFYFKVVYHNPITEELSLLLAYPAQKIGDDFKIELNEESVQKLNCNYFWQLKYVPNDEGELNDAISGRALSVIGEELKLGEGRVRRSGDCPRCNEEAKEMYAKVMSINRFNTDEETQQRVKTICETYTKYMDRFYMNTCWIKAHYFAQISVESGANLKCNPENMNYTRERLEEVFKNRLFYTDANGQQNYRAGMKEKIDAIYQLPSDPNNLSNQRAQAIANFIYFGVNGNRTDKDSKDGWIYRGGGMIQLTGKSVYNGTERAIEAFLGKKISLGGADKLSADVELSTIASMVYLAKRKIHVRKFTENKNGIKKMYFIANGQNNEYFVSKLVGSEHAKNQNGKTNFDLKQDFFDEFYKAFQTNKCQWDEEFKEEEDNVNIYRIDLDEFSLYKYQENKNSDEFIYKIYNHGKKVCEDYHFTQVLLPKRGIKLMPFPESGPNWGRYGARDKGGDNFVSETTCACLLGLFYSLPLNGHDEKYFYDDITIYSIDNTHRGHRSGNDIDVRYPNGTQQPVRFWGETIQQCFNGNKAKFIAHLESFVKIARKWCFVNNFTHEEVAGTTKAKSHEHHIHLGNKYYERYIKNG